ncbi:hypothetical protein MIND_00110300 [Mycena indigotica]|uniref:Uncharacterized protein n=1 Tax=Mycena indigotica TaxID=2126181 RepID=A0A8H6TBW9_9AGAR|nr:uncharacterized protein MIND_00110300 [Mycena indigotica]KAF7315935.1 hypothetical protein MIND_00110300 [Mycena indigotica]
MAQYYADGAQLPNAGVVAPYQPDFDFSQFLVQPIPRENYNLPLETRNMQNASIEAHNTASCNTTQEAEDDKQGTRDVGPPLKPFFAYTSDEIREYAEDETLYKILKEQGPVPLIFARLVANFKRQLSDAKAAAPSLEGSFVGKADGLRTRRGTIIPESIIVAASLGSPPPLFALTQRHLDEFNKAPSSVPVRNVHHPKLGNRLTQAFDSETFMKNIGPHTTFTTVEAFPLGFGNLLECFETLKIIATYLAGKNPPPTSIATHVCNHIDWIQTELPNYGAHINEWLPWSWSRLTEMFSANYRHQEIEYNVFRELYKNRIANQCSPAVPQTKRHAPDHVYPEERRY